MKQICKTQDIVAQNIIKYQFKSSAVYEKVEQLKRKPVHGQFGGDLERPSADKVDAA
jgi:hypothetical protein